MSTKYNPTPERERPRVFSCDEKESAQAQADRPTSKRMVQRVLAVTTEPNEMGTPLRILSQRKERIGSLSRRIVISALIALTLLASLMSTAVPRAAASVGPAGWGYVWANNPWAANYTPSFNYQFNSTGATNTIMRRWMEHKEDKHEA